MTEKKEVADVVAGSEIPWATFFEGIEVKVLRACFATNTYTLMTRFAPGTVLPRHKHFGPVEAYTIQGKWHYKEYDWVAKAGDYVHEVPGATHTLHVFDENTEPTIVFFIVQGGMALLNDDDEVFLLEDVNMMVERYRDTLEYQGDKMPDLLD
ncbi:MAG: 2,4'-dihydroxyacetophenone dioxygenase family protein [Polyangiaceae bacterium]|nr:2,4'-dihydroxyacetophenone dioxygenase family protein [Polyangiaceae bacterium]